MRVQLSIHRQELPPADLLWSLPNDRTGPTTIAQLIEDVNNVVPLESEHWGLEDYVLQLGRYECLHFSRVQELFKDNDRLTIRPLQTQDLRARTLSGRHQITADGKHLYDGIPFGRPYLKRPVRPEIHIPSRRECLPTTTNDDGDTVTGVINSSATEGMHSPQEIGQIAFKEGEVDNNPLALTDGSTEERRVHFMGEDHGQTQAIAGVTSDSEASEDYSPSQTDSDDEEDEIKDTDEISSSSDTTSDTSTDGSSSTESSEAETHLVGQVNGGTLMKDDSVCLTQSVHQAAPAQHTQTRNPPGQGKNATKARNLRKKKAKTLIKYKQVGALHPNANLESLKRILPSLGQHDPEGEASDTDRGTTGDAVRRAEDASPIEQPHVLDGSPQPLIQPKINGLPRYPEVKGAEVRNGDISNTGNMPSEYVSEQSNKPHIRPFRLNMPAANRLICGSLGIKTKKTTVIGPSVSNSGGEDQTREAHPQPVGHPGPREQSESSSGQPQSPSELTPVSQDPDYWQSKINLMARECVLPNHTPRVPSFPYHHPLPPPSVVGKRKRLQKHGDSHVTLLPYDEEDIEVEIEERPTKTRRIDTAFPDFPTDMGSLPALTRDNIGVGQIIAFHLMELVDGCPEIGTKYHMAKVVNLTTHGNELELEMAEEFVTQMHEVTEEGTIKLELHSIIEPRLIA
ncbi:MAG: hypothetical protein Q9157_003957 [Trypethelium eluteriae]